MVEIAVDTSMGADFSLSAKKMQVFCFAPNETKTRHDRWMDDLRPFRDVGDRIDAALVEAGYTKQRHKNLTAVLSRLWGVKISTVSDWRKGKKCPTMEHSRMIAMTLGVCVDWILTGRGPKRPGDIDDDDGNFLLLDMTGIPEDQRVQFEKAVSAVAQSVREMMANYGGGKA